MATTLSLLNFSTANIAETTQVSTDASAGAVSVVVKNANNLAIDDYVVIGLLGSELSELKRITGLSTQTLTVSATSFAHKANEPVSELRGNQIKVYRAANVDGTQPSDGSFSLLTTVDIDVDQPFTIYTDSTGGSDYWYKQTYYHSVSTAETAIADSTAVRGGDYGHYVTIEEVRIEAGFTNNPDVTDQMISDRRDDAESQVNGVLKSAKYTLPLTAPYPPVIKNITKLLAAGYLLLQDYGVGADSTNKEGRAKIELAEMLLGKIMRKEIVLVDQFTSSELGSSSILRGWPDSSTATASVEDAGGDIRTRISQIL